MEYLQELAMCEVTKQVSANFNDLLQRSHSLITVIKCIAKTRSNPYLLFYLLERFCCSGKISMTLHSPLTM